MRICGLFLEVCVCSGGRCWLSGSAWLDKQGAWLVYFHKRSLIDSVRLPHLLTACNLQLADGPSQTDRSSPAGKVAAPPFRIRYLLLLLLLVPLPRSFDSPWVSHPNPLSPSLLPSQSHVLNLPPSSSILPFPRPLTPYSTQEERTKARSQRFPRQR